MQESEPLHLEELEVFYGGERVSRFELTPALSDDPFITFAPAGPARRAAPGRPHEQPRASGSRRRTRSASRDGAQRDGSREGGRACASSSSPWPRRARARRRCVRRRGAAPAPRPHRPATPARDEQLADFFERTKGMTRARPRVRGLGEHPRRVEAGTSWSTSAPRRTTRRATSPARSACPSTCSSGRRAWRSCPPRGKPDPPRVPERAHGVDGARRPRRARLRALGDALRDDRLERRDEGEGRLAPTRTADTVHGVGGPIER